MRQARNAADLRGFTLVEALVILAILAAVISLLVPTVGRAVERSRIAKGASQVRQVGVGATLYANEHDRRLPQVWVEIGAGQWIQNVYGFVGSAGSIDEVGLNELHAGARPLNRYLGEYGDGDVVDAARDPLDRGASNALPLVRDVRTGSMFDLVGTSYVLNTHALDEVPCPYAPTVRTLTPGRDEPMPRVESPARTWLVGDHAMYNFDGGVDAGFRWRRSGELRANVAFVDGHAQIDVEVAQGAINTTSAYTFYPTPDWAARVGR
jgi:prepilin-type processing-associated H-X9-DG protein